MADPPAPELVIITVELVKELEDAPLIRLVRVLSFPSSLGINLQRLDRAIAEAARIITTP